MSPRRRPHALRAAGIDYWLFGGGAVEFWVGRITRDHDDTDAAAWRQDHDRIREAMLSAGWRHTPVENEVVGTRYAWQPSELEFTFVEARGGGEIVIPFPAHEIIRTVEAFGEERRSLHGVQARVIPLELLLEGKQRPREAPDEAAKDVADCAALSDL